MFTLLLTLALCGQSKLSSETQIALDIWDTCYEVRVYYVGTPETDAIWKNKLQKIADKHQVPYSAVVKICTRSDQMELIKKLGLVVDPGKDARAWSSGLHKGIARVTAQILPTGALATITPCIEDPTMMRELEDVVLVWDTLNDEKMQNIHNQRMAHYEGVKALTKVDVLEPVFPDSQYNNRTLWVRGLVNGKIRYIHADALRNCEY